MMKKKSDLLIDTVGERKKRNCISEGHERDVAILSTCETDWENLRSFRENRDRCLRYTYGDQWNDIINVRGKDIRERDYISQQGLIPLVNNLIRKNINTVVGLYTRQETEPVCSSVDKNEAKFSELMTIILQANWKANQMRAILATGFEEFLISGSAFSRESYSERNGRMDSWTDLCNPAFMFFNAGMRDPRHTDLTRIGQMHDLSFNQLISAFSHSYEDYNFLKQQYMYQRSGDSSLIDYNMYNNHERIAFYEPIDQALCRVFEVWTQETKCRYRCFDPLKGELYKIEVADINTVVDENRHRVELARREGIPDEEIPLIEYEWMVDTYWYYRFLTPTGYILSQGESPYWHKSHPYTIKLYPFVNGRIQSYVGDQIDQQRYINRMITMNDFMIKMTAKGVLLVPEDAIPDSMRPEDFADQWTSVDGVIIYSPKPGVPPPTQISNKSTNVGTYEMIQLQINMLDMVSGAHGALQGRTPAAGTSGASYAMQSQNATASLSNLTSRFSDFTKELSIKKTKTIQQYYDGKRFTDVAGMDYSDFDGFSPEKVRDMEFEMSITESLSSPTARARSNEMLLQFYQSGAITIEMLLENGDFPFADSLLQQIKSFKEDQAKAMAGQQGNLQVPQISPEVMQEIQKRADQGNVNQAMQLLTR